MKATSLIMIQTNYFHTWAKLPFSFHQHYSSVSWGSIQYTVRVRFHLCGAVAERSPLGGADFWVSVFSCCVFPLWRCGGGAEAGVRGGSVEWVLEPFFRSALRSGSGLASTLLKYRSHYIDIKNTPIALLFDRRISCCAAVPFVKFQSYWRALSINKIRKRDSRNIDYSRGSVLD